MKRFRALMGFAWLIFFLTAAAGGADEKTPGKWAAAETRAAVKKQMEDNAVGAFDFESRTVLLNNGRRMPLVGLGTYALKHDACVNAVMALLKAGGRLIDTAHFYKNEGAVGEGVRRAMKEYGIPREEIFVTTKLYPNQYADPETAIAQSLEKLNIGYIDLLLLHHPGKGDADTYKAMEKAMAEGNIRSLGLSNWYVRELKAFLPRINVMPVLVQNEIHPFYQERDVVPFIQSLGIAAQSWYPLGGRGYTKELLEHEALAAIARAHKVSVPQIILRWNVQRGVTVIPGSGNPNHIRENLDIFDFTLSAEEMEAISRLDRNEKHDWY